MIEVLGFVITLIVFDVVFIKKAGSKHQSEYRLEYGYRHFGCHDI